MDDRQADSPLALLERAKSGDKDAFGALAEEYRNALLRLCYKMTGSHETAEDLVQETLLKAYTHIAAFELRSSMATWLHRIATNACLDHQRSRKPWDIEKRWQWFRENGELVEQMEQNLVMSPERVAEVKEVAATCVNCITMSLPAKQRAAIVLCDQLGMSRAEAAESMNASVASVKTELHRARKTMTGVFENHCQLVDKNNDCNGCIVAGRMKQAAAQPPSPATEGKRAMNCDAIEELLSDLIDDELPVATRAGVEAHIAGCPQCATSYRQLRRSVRFVRSNADAPLVHGTPGGAYAEFTRALTDPAYGHSGTELMAEYIKPEAPAEGDVQ